MTKRRHHDRCGCWAIDKAYCKNYTSLAELVCVNSYICYVSIGFNNFAFQIFKYHTNCLLRLYSNKKHRYAPIHACNNRDILCTVQTLVFLTLPCASAILWRILYQTIIDNRMIWRAFSLHRSSEKSCKLSTHQIQYMCTLCVHLLFSFVKHNYVNVSYKPFYCLIDNIWWTIFISFWDYNFTLSRSTCFMNKCAIHS